MTALQHPLIPTERNLLVNDLLENIEDEDLVRRIKELAGFPLLTNIEFLIWFKQYLEKARAINPYPESLRYVDATLADVQRMRNTPTNPADTEPQESPNIESFGNSNTRQFVGTITHTD